MDISGIWLWLILIVLSVIPIVFTSIITAQSEKQSK